MTAVRGELLAYLSALEEGAARGHREVHDRSSEAVGQLWRRMTSVFQEDVMRLQVRVDQAVHKAVRDVKIHNQSVQEDVHSKLSAVVEMAVPVVDDACKEPATEECVELEDERGSVEPVVQIVSPARAVEVTEEKS